MECPKCGAEIDKNTIVCPNCKKVLKIICPDCKTINTKNVCKTCGKILVTKCAKCGKINLTKNKSCVKCGFSTEKSAVIAESNTDEFAVLRIDFPNIDLVKAKLDSNKLFQKFKSNLDNLIKTYLSSINVRRQIYNTETYIIRFNKDYTLSSSANSAILTAVELANLITRLNLKLTEKFSTFLKCNFTIMKRSTEDNPYDINTNFQANMVYQSTDKDKKILDAFQVITDESFIGYYQENYNPQSLDSTLVDGVMIRFFEIDIKKFIKLDEILREINNKKSSQEIPNYIQNALIDQDKLAKDSLKEESKIDEDEDIYDIEMINFDEINCNFIKSESINVLDVVVKVLQQNPKGILALKASNAYQPYTLKLLSAVEEIGIYSNVIPLTCNDEMKYSPYSFFRELILAVFDYTISQKLIDTNDFSIFNNIDGKDLVEDLIKLTQRQMNNPDLIQNRYFQVFLSVLEAIPDTLIYIEDFEKIDESSMYALQQLFEHLDEVNISYLISYDKSFSLHKKSHVLLSRPYYTEVTLTPAPDEKIIEGDKNFYENIMTDFYFQRIMKYASGSTLFIDFAIQYLLECQVYAYTSTSIVMANPKTIIIPAGLDKIIQRRLILLQEENPDIVRFLTTIVLLGTRIDEKTILSLGFENWEDLGQKLAEMGYIYSYNNCIYFSNYNILRTALLEISATEQLQAIAQSLFEKVYSPELPSSIKAYLYNLMENGEQVIFEWEKLANVSLSMGDISAYLNCSSMILDSLDKYSQNWPAENLEMYKKSLFENIANNMTEYNPEHTKIIAEQALHNLQSSSNPDGYMMLCAKMVQGSIMYGDYLYAMNLAHSILSSMDKASIDPAAENFNLYFLLMSVIYVKILFNIGAYNDCLDIGYNILNVIDSAKLNSIEYTVVSKEEFIYLVTEMVGYIGIVDVITMREDAQEFFDITKKLLDFIPDEYSTFVQLQNLIKGKPVQINKNVASKNVFSALLYHIINAYVSYLNNPDNFAREIYKAKLIANETMMYQFELFADLLIGWAYIHRGQYKKASSIIYKIIKTAKEKGMNAIVHTGWYIMSILNIQEGKFDIAYGVLNNSNIQMEKRGTVTEFLTMLHKINMYKVLMNMNSQEQAQICLNQAAYITQKYGLNFNLNIDTEKIMLENSSTDKS